MSIYKKSWLGFGILLFSFFLLKSFHLWWALFVGGLIAWYVTFGKEETKRELTTKPRQLKWIFLMFVLMLFYNVLMGGFFVKVLGFNWAGNSLDGHVSSYLWKIPFMLFGEELLGIGIFKGVKQLGKNTVIANLCSGLVFGLLHVFTYWDGSVFSTVLHVLVLQSVARLFLNVVYLKTGSIYGSWISHVIFDLVAFAIPSLMVKLKKFLLSLAN